MVTNSVAKPLMSNGALVTPVFFIAAMAFLFVSKYVKKVFFLELLGVFMGIGGLALTMVFSSKDYMNLFFPYLIAQMAFLLINGSGLFIVMLLKRINVIKTEKMIDIKEEKIEVIREETVQEVLNEIQNETEKMDGADDDSVLGGGDSSDGD